MKRVLPDKLGVLVTPWWGEGDPWGCWGVLNLNQLGMLYMYKLPQWSSSLLPPLPGDLSMYPSALNHPFDDFQGWSQPPAWPGRLAVTTHSLLPIHLPLGLVSPIWASAPPGHWPVLKAHSGHHFPRIILTPQGSISIFPNYALGGVIMHPPPPRWFFFQGGAWWSPSSPPS